MSEEERGGGRGRGRERERERETWRGRGRGRGRGRWRGRGSGRVFLLETAYFQPESCGNEPRRQQPGRATRLPGMLASSCDFLPLCLPVTWGCPPERCCTPQTTATSLPAPSDENFQLHVLLQNSERVALPLRILPEVGGMNRSSQPWRSVTLEKFWKVSA
jgi:hypothetical protein